jgi:hypothetical protein
LDGYGTDGFGLEEPMKADDIFVLMCFRASKTTKSLDPISRSCYLEGPNTERPFMQLTPKSEQP